MQRTSVRREVDRRARGAGGGSDESVMRGVVRSTTAIHTSELTM